MAREIMSGPWSTCDIWRFRPRSFTPRIRRRQGTKHAASYPPAKTVALGGPVITPSFVSRNSGERMELRADLHLHTRERESFIAYDARDLIDRAARSGFQVLSITNHDTVTFSAGLRGYAQERGILLIPGIEATIEGKHVLLYNIDVPPERIRTFAD